MPYVHLEALCSARCQAVSSEWWSFYNLVVILMWLWQVLSGMFAYAATLIGT